jgi:hypothetical protein
MANERYYVGFEVFGYLLSAIGHGIFKEITNSCERFPALSIRQGIPFPPFSFTPILLQKQTKGVK